MGKVLVNIYIPVISAEYDVLIPIQSQIFEVTELIIKAIYELSEKRFIPTEDTVLSYRENGEIIDTNSTVYDLGISNGVKLMLI